MKERNESLDALRGISILLMVLSGSIAFGNVLPGWMYHAQLPPPDHVFQSEIPGITWVDLVFPFFLFSMGAAFPLSFAKKIAQNKPWQYLAWSIVKRGLLLAFFSIFTMNVLTYANEQASTKGWLLSILAFTLIHCMFVQWPAYVSRRNATIIKILAFVIAIFILSQLQYKNGSGFSITRVDIIIMILANMAVVGSATWLLTKNNMWHRILILPFIMGLFLSSSTAHGWAQTLLSHTAIPGIYNPNYLKYLFIIIPGTIAGNWLMGQMKTKQSLLSGNKTEISLLSVLSFLIVIVNLITLYYRHLLTGLFTSFIIGALTFFLAKKISFTNRNNIYIKMTSTGFYLLILGLIFEAYEGGIKKDEATYSYFFVSCGLAFFILCALVSLENAGKFKSAFKYFSGNGKNPMVAYIAGNFILLPLLNITAAMPLLNGLNSNAWLGFLRGLIFTTSVSLITLLFVKWKWYWKS